MTETLYKNSPSNRLYRGEVTEFRDAVKTYIAQLQNEVEKCRDNAARFDSDEAEHYANDFTQQIKEAQSALREYDAEISKLAIALFQKWSAGSDSVKKWLGDAALDGDYSQLAI